MRPYFEAGRDIFRMEDPRAGDAWERWAAGEDPVQIREDLYPDAPENAP